MNPQRKHLEETQKQPNNMYESSAETVGRNKKNGFKKRRQYKPYNDGKGPVLNSSKRSYRYH